MARLEISSSTTTPVELNVGSQFSMQRTNIKVHPAWVKYRNNRLNWLTQVWHLPADTWPTSKDILRTKYNAVETLEKTNDIDSVTYLDFDSDEDMMIFLLEWS
jgi:hypothetical protein